jgi:hypothetical protein
MLSFSAAYLGGVLAVVMRSRLRSKRNAHRALGDSFFLAALAGFTLGLAASYLSDIAVILIYQGRFAALPTPGLRWAEVTFALGGSLTGPTYALLLVRKPFPGRLLLTTLGAIAFALSLITLLNDALALTLTIPSSPRPSLRYVGTTAGLRLRHFLSHGTTASLDSPFFVYDSNRIKITIDGSGLTKTLLPATEVTRLNAAPTLALQARHRNTTIATTLLLTPGQPPNDPTAAVDRTHGRRITLTSDEHAPGYPVAYVLIQGRGRGELTMGQPAVRLRDFADAARLRATDLPSARLTWSGHPEWEWLRDPPPIYSFTVGDIFGTAPENVYLQREASFDTPDAHHRRWNEPPAGADAFFGGLLQISNDPPLQTTLALTGADLFSDGQRIPPDAVAVITGFVQHLEIRRPIWSHEASYEERDHEWGVRVDPHGLRWSATTVSMDAAGFAGRVAIGTRERHFDSGLDEISMQSSQLLNIGGIACYFTSDRLSGSALDIGWSQLLANGENLSPSWWDALSTDQRAGIISGLVVFLLGQLWLARTQVQRVCRIAIHGPPAEKLNRP